MYLTRLIRNAVIVGVVYGFVCVPLSADPGKIRRLIKEVWKEPPQYMDLVINQRLVQPPVSEEKLRAMLEAAYDDMQRAEDAQFPWRRSRTSLRELYLDEAVEFNQRDQRKPKLLRRRYRIAPGGRYRLDETRYNDEEQFGEDVEFQASFINSGRLDNGYFESLEYHYDRKTATRMAALQRPFWKAEEVWRMNSVGAVNTLIIMVATAKHFGVMEVNGVEIPRPVIDDEKLEVMVNGEHPELTILVQDSLLDEVLVDRFELLVKGKKHARSTIFTARDDPSRVFRVELWDMETGELQQVVESKDFGQEGFPRWWKQSTFMSDGFVAIDERETVDVKFDDVIPADVFAFKVPEGFLGGEELAEKVIIHHSDGRVEEKPRLRQPPPPLVQINQRRWLLYVNGALLALVLAYHFRRKLQRSAKQAGRT